MPSLLGRLKHFAILGLLFALSAPALASVCEDEVNTMGALTRILRAGLDLGELNTGKILNRILGEKIENPFLKDGRSAKNLALTQGFARHLSRLKDSQQDAFRAVVRNMIASKLSQSELVGEARENTKLILGMTAEEMPAIDFNEPYIAGTYRGRPLFIGKLRGPTGRTNPTLIDPLGPPNFRIRDLEKGNLREGGEIFEWKGRSVYALGKSGTIHDLEEPSKSPFPKIDLQLPAHKNGLSKGSAVVVTENSVRIVSSWHPKTFGLEKNDPDAPRGLGFAEWSDNPQPFRFVTTEEPEHLMPFKVSAVDGHSILPYMVKDQRHMLRFYDFSNDQVYAVTAQENRTFLPAIAPIAFRRDQKLAALVAIKNQAFQARLGITALDASEEIEDLNLVFTNLLGFEQLEYENERFALIWTIGSLSLLDLQRGNLLWTIEHRYKSQVNAQFQFRGEPYLLLGTPYGEVHLAELKTGIVLNRLKVSDRSPVQINTFESNGLPMALIPGRVGRPPVLLHLVKEESR